MKVALFVDIELDNAALEAHGRQQHKPEAAVVADAVAECGERITRALRGAAVLQVEVRTLFESDRARKLVDA